MFSNCHTTCSTIIIFGAMAMVAITASAFRYLYFTAYAFHIEAPCVRTDDTTCFVRDCDEYCPPNGLELYQVFEIPAVIFHDCADNSCSNICPSADCTPILCDPEFDQCSS